MLTFPRQTLGIGLLCRLSAHIAAPRGDGRRQLPGHRGSLSPRGRAPLSWTPGEEGRWDCYPHLTLEHGADREARVSWGSAARSRAAVTAG